LPVDWTDVTESSAGEFDFEPAIDQLLDVPNSPVAPEWMLVGRLLMAIEAPVGVGPQPGEQGALRAFRAAVNAPSRRPTRRRTTTRRRGLRLGLAAAIGALSFSGGAVALAAAGSLPDAAQRAAHDALATIGVHVPAGPSHPSGRSRTPGHAPGTPQKTAHPTPQPSHSARPTHPAHPVHPTHPPTPSQAAQPTHPAHPSHPAQSTASTHPTHPAHPSTGSKR
jgi:hypothetical protein